MSDTHDEGAAADGEQKDPTGAFFGEPGRQHVNLLHRLGRREPGTRVRHRLQRLARRQQRRERSPRARRSRRRTRRRRRASPERPPPEAPLHQRRQASRRCASTSSALGDLRPVEVRALEAVRRAERVGERADRRDALSRVLLERGRHHGIERRRDRMLCPAAAWLGGFGSFVRISSRMLGPLLPLNGTLPVMHS